MTEGIQRGREQLQQRFKQALFHRQRAVVGGKRLVFKGFQLGCDVALDVFKRLSALVFDRHLARVALRNFDVKTTDAVVFDAQIGDACALPFCGFHRGEKRAAVVLNRAQFVEISAVAACDHAAIAHDQCGLVHHGALQERQPFGRDIDGNA